jgi:hypothetical protein
MGKYQDFVGVSLDWIIVDGYCRWKLSSGNLYSFIGPNQDMGKYQDFVGITLMEIVECIQISINVYSINVYKFR